AAAQQSPVPAVLMNGPLAIGVVKSKQAAAVPKKRLKSVAKAATEIPLTRPIPEVILDDVIHFMSYCLRNVATDVLSSQSAHKQARIWCIHFIFKHEVLVPAYSEKLQKKPSCVDGKLKIT
ncbi:unnamed protein product, partial [Prorocentrum cordatum]